MSAVSTDERRAFDDWSGPHLPVMRMLAVRLAGPVDADDVVQDALLRAWSRRTAFDRRRGGPRPWLLALVADQARQRRRRAVPCPAPLELAVEDGSRLPQAAGADAADLDLRAAVERLPERQRLAVECHYYLGLKTKETAQVMDCAAGTVKSTLAAARTALRAQLGEDHR